MGWLSSCVLFPTVFVSSLCLGLMLDWLCQTLALTLTTTSWLNTRRSSDQVKREENDWTPSMGTCMMYLKWQSSKSWVWIILKTALLYLRNEVEYSLVSRVMEVLLSTNPDVWSTIKVGPLSPSISKYKRCMQVMWSSKQLARIIWHAW